MKKHIALVFVLACVMGLVGCGKQQEHEDENGESYFNAVVTDLRDKYIMVKVTEGFNSGITAESEVVVTKDVFQQTAALTLPLKKISRVVFNGEVMETYPLARFWYCLFNLCSGRGGRDSVPSMNSDPPVQIRDVAKKGPAAV
ncbi:MAG: hypothetical protein ACI3VB_07140 [Oscillospiraceae bacterium]